MPKFDQWNNLSKVIYYRTYSRKKEDGKNESWDETVERVIAGNTDKFEVEGREKQKLRTIMSNLKATPAGRGLWYSGSPSHKKLNGTALNNCWALSGDDWNNLVMAQDLLMLGGGVGLSIEDRYVSKLPRVKKDVSITHQKTTDADLIVSDSREGWCELTRKVLKSFFETGKSFTYSTLLLRGKGEPIKGFGGISSGPLPLINAIEKISKILKAREGSHVRSIDVMDIICSIGEMVVSGNVRRSAIIILGDCWDKEYLTSKRWDLGQIPTQRAMANLSVVCDDIDDLHPLFWKTYESGEPFGIINRSNIKKYGRMGHEKHDSAYLVNPCAEAVLESGEPCNLLEVYLPNLKDEDEFEEVARAMFRYGKRVTLENYHHEVTQKVVHKNRRVGIGITGCLQSPLFNKETLDRVYRAIQDEDKKYSKELGVEPSIRTTLIKPSGTLSLLANVTPGIHPSFSKYYIRRVRFASNDPLVPILKEAGHYIESVIKFDGLQDHNTVVVDFYCETPDGTPVADENWDTWKQLEYVKNAQKWWADQSISVTVYYKKEDIDKLKEWLRDNLPGIKTISFLCHNDHGFKQAPIEAITKEKYEEAVKNIKNIKLDSLSNGVPEIDLGLECEGGACPVK